MRRMPERRLSKISLFFMVSIVSNKRAIFKEDFEFLKGFVRMRFDEDFIG
jgi:hypothetical protein